MWNMRIRVAAGLMTAVLSLLGGARAVASAPEATVEVRYACQPAQRFVVTKSASQATVSFIDRTYILQRKPSSIGEKYGSATAALIVDGPSAVFVAEDRLQLGKCVEAVRIAAN